MTITKDQALNYKNLGYGMVALSKTIPSDETTPIIVLKKLKALSENVFLLESATPDERAGRYSFLGYNPKFQLTAHSGKCFINGEKVKGSPQEIITGVKDKYKSPQIPGRPTLTGGLVGYFSYEYLQYIEEDLNYVPDQNYKDVDLMFFDKIICFDHFKNQIQLFKNILLDDDLDENYDAELMELDQMVDTVVNGSEAEIEDGKLLSDLTPHFSQEEYSQMVQAGIKEIENGKIEQIVLSNYLTAQHSGSLLNVYRQLRRINPSPYMVYFNNSDIEIAAASPETLVKVENNRVYNYPLAGTRPRGKNIEEEQKLEKELLNDEKEITEHKMLVDLSVSDIQKISVPGSVEVSSFMDVLKYSHVMHLGSVVEGELSPDSNELDAMSTLFPAGTLSGSPKVTACQLIKKLENDRRNIYGGAIGYLDMAGNLDTCIAIRLAFKHKNDNQLIIRSGAGIVKESNPETEFQECLNKAQAVVEAVTN